VLPLRQGLSSWASGPERLLRCPTAASNALLCSGRPQCPLGGADARPCGLRKADGSRPIPARSHRTRRRRDGRALATALVQPDGLSVRSRSTGRSAAARLDPVGLSMLINEHRHRFGRRSSSAWAKKAAALRRISFARRSSRFSRSSSLM